MDFELFNWTGTCAPQSDRHHRHGHHYWFAGSVVPSNVWSRIGRTEWCATTNDSAQLLNWSVKHRERCSTNVCKMTTQWNIAFSKCWTIQSNTGSNEALFSGRPWHNGTSQSQNVELLSQIGKNAEPISARRWHNESCRCLHVQIRPKIITNAQSTLDVLNHQLAPYCTKVHGTPLNCTAQHHVNSNAQHSFAVHNSRWNCIAQHSMSAANLTKKLSKTNTAANITNRQWQQRTSHGNGATARRVMRTQYSQNVINVYRDKQFHNKTVTQGQASPTRLQTNITTNEKLNLIPSTRFYEVSR